MSLRANTYIVLMSSLFLALAVVLAGLLYGTRVNVVTVEVRSAREEMQRILRVIGHEQSMLDDTESDWAQWDEAYSYLQGDNPGFPKANLPPNELDDLNLNAVAFFDRSGRVVWSSSRNLGERASSVATQTLDALAPPQLRTLAAATHPTRRLAAIGGKLVLESISPITNTAGTATPAGSLLFARVIDTSQVRGFAGSSGTTLSVFSAAAVPGDQGEDAMAHLSPHSPIWIGLTRPHEVVAYALISQVAVGPALVLAAPMHTLVYDVTPPLIAVLVAALVVVGLAWSNATYQLIERTSLSRMSWLRHAVASVGASGQTGSRIDMDRAPSGDEVLGIASEINTMLDALETSQLARFQSEERMRALVENMADAVLVIDRDGVVTFASNRINDLTGRSPLGLIGSDICSVLTGPSRAAIDHLLHANPPREGALSAEVTFVSALGSTTPAEIAASPVWDPSGAISGYQLIARDVSERKRFEDQLVHLAEHDHLTGLYNRRRFEEELARELAESRRHGSVGSLLWLDLDGFKEINDSLGHRRGDELLVEVASKLRSSSRADQIVARLGGDEFAVLMPNATRDQAARAASRILSEIRTGVAGDAERVWITASLGIVSFPEHGTGVEELTSHADFAMYTAKREGRNRYAFYQPEDGWTRELTERRSWASRIETALHEERFLAFAQPLVSLADGSIAAYELLVRLRAEDGTLTTPAAFLDAAESLGLVTEIDRFMIRRATDLIDQGRAQGRRLNLHVNLSAATIGDQGLLRYVTRLLDEHEIDPSCLGFEITETALIHNMGRALRFMSELRKLGCTFSLDDFGSGFTSFYQLRHMPIDLLKIDGSIVRDLPKNVLDQHVLKAIVELSRGLDMRSVAEWVEDAETEQLLRDFGVDLVQGFHLARPFPAEELVAIPPNESAMPA